MNKSYFTLKGALKFILSGAPGTLGVLHIDIHHNSP